MGASIVSNRWVEKHRPKKLKDYVCRSEAQRREYEGWIEDGDVPGHLLLFGPPGAGKTTLVLVLLNELKVDRADTLIINASRDNGVDMIRTRIRNFCDTMALGDSPFKAVLLDEADHISAEGQAALRREMEIRPQIRFFLTCNYESRIIPPIKDRCVEIHVGDVDEDAVLERVCAILEEEEVEVDDVELIETYVKAGGGSLRRTIQTIQRNVRDGKLVEPESESDDGGWKFEMVKLFKAGKIRDARTLICQKAAPTDFTGLYTFLYRNTGYFAKDDDETDEAVIVIAEGLDRNSRTGDPEITFSATMAKLGMLGRE